MAIKEGLLPEFDHEMGSTRRVLERVPEADFLWQPHDRSFPMGTLAGHIASLPDWIHTALDEPGFDVATLDAEARGKSPASTAALLQDFDGRVKKAREKIDAQIDASFLAPWTLKQAGQEMFTMPKIAVIRSFVMNHVIHHRGQLTVYLRLRNVPVPALYGPSADEG
jgi:uncharacterized damage-inducible protein DinB